MAGGWWSSRRTAALRYTMGKAALNSFRRRNYRGRISDDPRLLSPDDRRWFTLTSARVRRCRGASRGRWRCLRPLRTPTPVLRRQPSRRMEERPITAHAGGSKTDVKPCVRVWDSVHGGEITTILQSEAWRSTGIVTAITGRRLPPSLTMARCRSVESCRNTCRQVIVVRTGAVPEAGDHGPCSDHAPGR